MAGWALEAGGRHWEGIVLWSDLEFWFPCDDPFHCGCGFFEWTLCLETAEFHRGCMEENENGHDAWDFIIVDAPVIEQNRLAYIARGWLERWVPQLAAKPIRAVPYEESRRIWARFEEMHPDAGQVDVLRVCQQRIVEIESGTAKNLFPSTMSAGATLRKPMETTATCDDSSSRDPVTHVGRRATKFGLGRIADGRKRRNPAGAGFELAPGVGLKPTIPA